MSQALTSGFGAKLAAARESCGLTIADVAARLKLTPRQVAALEAEDWTDLPDPVFVRGFVRNYAKIVGVPVEELIPAVNGAETVTQTIAAPSAGVRLDSTSVARWLIWSLLWVVLFVAVVVGLYTWLKQDEHALPPAETLPPAGTVPPAENATAVATVPAGEGDAIVATSPQSAALGKPKPPSEQAPAPQSAPQPATDSEQTPVPAAAPPQASGAPTAATPGAADTRDNASTSAEAQPRATALPQAGNASAVAAPGAAGAQEPGAAGTQDNEPASTETQSQAPASLRFTTSREVWIKVVDAKGMRFAKLVPGGAVAVFSGTPPFQLVVGNASVVSVVYNGRVVDLKPHARKQVARLTLE